MQYYYFSWCSNTDEYQSTDVHYRSMNGEGKFNWRMIFPLKYSIVEDMVSKNSVSFFFFSGRNKAQTYIYTYINNEKRLLIINCVNEL